MLKRLTWWAAGAAMGAGGSLWAQRKVKKKVAEFSPPVIAGAAVGAAKELTKDLRSVVNEGRAAMRQRESELRDELEGRLRKD